MADIGKLVDDIASLKSLTVLEAAELSKALEEKWGVSASAAVAVASYVEVPSRDDQVVEFDVILTGDGGQKISVIKEVRAITGLGLTEAKDLVERAPKAIKEGVSRYEALKIKEGLESRGATVELKGYSDMAPQKSNNDEDLERILQRVVSLSVESLDSPVNHLSYIRSKLEGI